MGKMEVNLWTKFLHFLLQFQPILIIYEIFIKIGQFGSKIVKYLLRRTTRLTELQRIVYGTVLDFERISKIGGFWFTLIGQVIKLIFNFAFGF